MIKIEMSHSEVLIAHLLGIMRNSAARKLGVTDKQMGKQDPVEIDQDGMLAEMAFCKHYNFYPDLTIKPKHGGVDVFGRKGQKIDVKSTRYKNGHLVIHIGKDPDAVDIYVLGVVDGNTVTLVGYIGSKEAMVPENIKDLGCGEGYAIEQADLLPL